MSGLELLFLVTFWAGDLGASPFYLTTGSIRSGKQCLDEWIVFGEFFHCRDFHFVGTFCVDKTANGDEEFMLFAVLENFVQGFPRV